MTWTILKQYMTSRKTPRMLIFKNNTTFRSLPSLSWDLLKSQKGEYLLFAPRVARASPGSRRYFYFCVGRYTWRSIGNEYTTQDWYHFWTKFLFFWLENVIWTWFHFLIRKIKKKLFKNNNNLELCIEESRQRFCSGLCHSKSGRDVYTEIPGTSLSHSCAPHYTIMIFAVFLYTWCAH